MLQLAEDFEVLKVVLRVFPPDPEVINGGAWRTYAQLLDEHEQFASVAFSNHLYAPVVFVLHVAVEGKFAGNTVREVPKADALD